MRITLFHLVFKNLFRKPVRSMAVFLAAALAGGLIFSSSVILVSVQKSLDRGMTMLGADIMVVPSGYEDKGRKVLLAGDPSSFYMAGDVLPRITAVRGVEKASPQIFITSSILECCSMPTVLLVGYDPATDFTITPWVQMANNASSEPIDEVILGVEALYASEGPAMEFFGKRFKIGQSLYQTGIGFLDFNIFMTMDAVRDMVLHSQTRSRQPLHIDPDQISSVLVKAGEGQDIHRIASDIEASIRGIKAIETREVITSVRRDAEVASWAILSVGLICWLMLIVLIGFIYSMTVNERARELGILRAMGAARLHVFRIIVAEALILTGAGSAAGALISWAVVANFKKLIMASISEVPFLWQSPAEMGMVGAVCILLITVTGAVAATYPALKISLREPYDVIHQGM